MDLAKVCKNCLARTEGKVCPGVKEGEVCLNALGPMYEDLPPGIITGRKPEECIPENDIRRLEEFTQAMLNKWWKGRQEHGVTIKIDPLEEAMKECLDISNYAMEQYFRIKKLREELNAEVQDR